MKLRLAILNMALMMCFCCPHAHADVLAKQISGDFVFAATWGDDVARVCFQLDGDLELGCVESPTQVQEGGKVGEHVIVGASVGDQIALLTVTISNDGEDHSVRPIACDASGNCSEPSASAAVVDFVPPKSPDVLTVQ